MAQIAVSLRHVFTKSVILLLALISLCSKSSNCFSLEKNVMKITHLSNSGQGLSRREAIVKSVAGFAFLGVNTHPAMAAPQIFTLDSGIKYAVTKESQKGNYPQRKDIVAVDYTGYLTSGQIFDSTHSEGKSNSLLFELGTGSVIPGLDDMVANMQVGQKVQAIIPPSLAYADKGVCLEDGECLIKPGSTLVYDIYLKKSSLPPP